MIELSNNSSIEVSIGSWNLGIPQSFRSFTISESAGLIIPTFQLVLSLPGFNLLPELKKSNLKVRIGYGPSSDRISSYDFLVSNYNYKLTNRSEYLLIITGVLDCQGFTNGTKIQMIEGSSAQAIGSISSLTPKIEYSSSDNQVWIQHSNTDKNFVERVLQHSYISDDAIVLYGINVGKELICKDSSKLLSQSPKVTFSNDSGYKFNEIHFESDGSLFSSLLSDGRKLPIIHIKDRKMDLMDSPSASEIKSNVNFLTQVDNGNCHENYYKAFINNLNKLTSIVKDCLYLYTDTAYFTKDELTILDLVRIASIDSNHLQDNDPVQGNYIVTEKVTYIAQDRYSTRLKLVRS